jgi:hypothetical protein
VPPRVRPLGLGTGTRSARWRAVLVLAAVALVQAGIGFSLTSSSHSAPDLTLASDADGVALVSATQLAPGHGVTRCLRLDYANAVNGDRLGLVSSSTGSLAGHLDVRIEAGTGGSAASCTGFTGSVVYSGTLSALTTAHGTAANALLLKTLPDGSSSMTVRLRFLVADTNAIQGTVAQSDLLWVGDALGDRTPPPPVVTPVDPTPPPGPVPPVPAPPTVPAQPTTPTVPTTPAVPTTAAIPPSPSAPTNPTLPTNPATPTTAAAPTAPAPTSAASTAPADPSASATATPTPGAAPSGPGSPTGPGGASKPATASGGGAITSVGRAFSSAANAVASAAGALAHAVGTQVIAPVAAAAAPAAKGAGIGLGGTAPLLGAFLLIQGRIDRRDPKLALAPAYADPDLTFDDIPRGPLNRRSTRSTAGPDAGPGG